MEAYHYLIFSKDRACQLDLLLQSIQQYCVNASLTVLYKASNQDFQDGYNRIQALYPNINWIAESYFYSNVLQIIQDSKSKCFGLLTDDSIFFNKLNFNDNELYDLLYQQNCYSFSPRCGFNTKQQCHWEPIFQQEIIPVWQNDNVIMWDFTKHSYSYNYGRPISLDGNIHIREQLLEILLDNSFNGPRTLDGINIDKLKPYLMSYKNSILVCNPVNMVFGGCADNYAKFYSYPIEILNTQFLQGNRLKLPNQDFAKTVKMSHMEFPLTWQ